MLPAGGQSVVKVVSDLMHGQVLTVLFVYNDNTNANYIPVGGSIKVPHWVITTIQLDRAAMLLCDMVVITQR